MRRLVSSCFFTLTVVSIAVGLVGCGGDDTPPATSGDGGITPVDGARPDTGTTTGDDSGTTTGDDSGTTTGDDGGTTGTDGGTMGSDGGTMSGSGAIGSACTNASDCTATAGEAMCIMRLGTMMFGFDLPGGYCTATCMPGSDSCGAGATCFGFGGGTMGYCVQTCMDDMDCRMGYVCRGFGGGGGMDVCLPMR